MRLRVNNVDDGSLRVVSQSSSAIGIVDVTVGKGRYRRIL